MSGGATRAVVIKALIGALALTLVLTGCSSNTDLPWFTTPIQWGGGYREGHEGASDIESVPTTVRLLDVKHAQLTDFPQGKSSKDDEGNLCLHQSTTKRYTGKARWWNVNGHTIVLKFGVSSVRVSSDTSGFGDQDWTSMIFNECGGASWVLGVKCGNPGYGGPGKKGVMASKPCRG